MSNQKEDHLIKNNFSDIFLRDVIVGFLGFLRNKIKLTYQSEENGEYVEIVPIYYSLTGDQRFIMDSFYDDIPGKRVNMNTDVIPRGVLDAKTWSPKPEEFTNPNIWMNITEEVDEELIQNYAQSKSVPMKISVELVFVVDNENEVFKLWQTMMECFYMYRYFNYTYKRFPLKAYFNFTGDAENVIAREYQFGTGVKPYKMVYNIEIHTHFPILDNTTKILTNKTANWDLTIHQNQNNISQTDIQ